MSEDTQRQRSSSILQRGVPRPRTSHTHTHTHRVPGWFYPCNIQGAPPSKLVVSKFSHQSNCLESLLKTQISSSFLRYTVPQFPGALIVLLPVLGNHVEHNYRHFLFFSAMLHSIQDLSSLTRDQICAPCSGTTESQKLDCQRSTKLQFRYIHGTLLRKCWLLIYCLSSNSTLLPACENLNQLNIVLLPNGMILSIANKDPGETLEEKRFSFLILVCSFSRLLQYV